MKQGSASDNDYNKKKGDRGYNCNRRKVMEASRRERKGTEPLDDLEKEKDGDGDWDWEPGEAYKRIDMGHLKNTEGLVWVSTRKHAGSAPAHFG